MRCRKDYRDLTTEERDRFVAGLYHVKASGLVDQFAADHDTYFHDGPHHSSFFTPWHREFVRRFEDALVAFDSRIAVPYWNSIEDTDTGSALWDNAFLGQFDAAWNLNRSPGGATLPSQQTLDDTLALGTYDEFWSALESSVHNAGHNFVGGVMQQTDSPGDPVFYLHHCFIDMCWAQWQLLHPAEPFTESEPGRGLNDPMTPYTTTPADVLDHRSIGAYHYPDTFAEQDTPLITPPASVNFNQVPEGETVLRAAVFIVDSCEAANFEVDPPVLLSGPAGTQFTRLAPLVAVDPHLDPNGRVWLTYTATSDGDEASATVHVRNVETGQEWDIPITASTIARPSAAVMMVLDQSNSMTFASGIAGVTRGQVLQFSAPPFVSVAYEDGALGICTFDHDAHASLGVTPLNGAGKILANAAIANYAPNPNGWTSIGEGLAFAHDLLAPVNGYEIKATVVLSDGAENHGPFDRRYIADVQDLIDERVYAIGLGTPENLNAGALQDLCDGHEGYLYYTGALNDDAFFRLSKYYQQILAGVQNNEMVLDPEDWIYPGQEHRIPFWLAETDIEATAVLLTPYPAAVSLALETPGGDIVDAALAAGHPQVELQQGAYSSFYRTIVPLPLGAATAHAGRWRAILKVSKQHGQPPTSTTGHSPSDSQNTPSRGIRYSFQVQSYSNLRMRARISQTSREPGATLTVQARLTEYGVPVAHRATVRAELERPGGSQSVLNLIEIEPGLFETSLLASASGIYRFRVLAEGHTMRGRTFTREQLLTGAVWAGGDRPSPTNPGTPEGDQDWCDIINCLLSQESIQRWLKRLEIDPQQILACIRDCQGKDPHPCRRTQLTAVEQTLSQTFGDPGLVRTLMTHIEQATLARGR